MRVFLTLILASGIYCRSLKSVRQEELQLSNEIPNASDDDGPRFLENSDLRQYAARNFGPEMYEKLYKYYLLIESKIDQPEFKLSQLDKAVYLFIKTMKQRNKRYTKLENNTKQACHFKMCHMGPRKGWGEMSFKDFLGAIKNFVID